jgi:hypothetical protein
VLLSVRRSLRVAKRKVEPFCLFVRQIFLGESPLRIDGTEHVTPLSSQIA